MVRPHAQDVADTQSDPAMPSPVRRGAMAGEDVVQREFAGSERHRNRARLIEGLDDRLGAAVMLARTEGGVAQLLRHARDDTTSMHPASLVAWSAPPRR